MARYAIACIAVSLIAGWIAHWWMAPPLRLVQEAPGVISVNVQTFGEYQTTVNRIRLYDFNQKTVVWEIAAQNGDAQIHQFILKAGDNSALVKTATGAYSVVVPKGAERFTPHKGDKYQLELLNGTTIFSKSSATFDFGN